jgi:hypothetical protein|tara:strand:+ start:430 stop:666 length:237 start_codon:yes stop_codon:yes gene_type:complete
MKFFDSVTWWVNTNQKSSLKDTFKSVAAAFLGVQSNESRKRDFSQGKLSQFIIVGIACVILFITVLMITVTIVIDTVS